MKKLCLLTLAMLTIGGAVAFAQESINLAWLACRTAANDANIALNDVTMAQFPCDANNSLRNLVVAVNTRPYVSFGGASVEIDFFTPYSLDWWDVGGKIADPGNCRAGGMVRATVGLHPSCANPYGAATQGGMRPSSCQAGRVRTGWLPIT